jgi:hypothetical protein
MQNPAAAFLMGILHRNYATVILGGGGYKGKSSVGVWGQLRKYVVVS